MWGAAGCNDTNRGAMWLLLLWFLVQDARLLSLENDFEDEMGTLEGEFTVERDAIVRQHTAERQELVDIMNAVAADEADKEQETRHVRVCVCRMRSARPPSPPSPFVKPVWLNCDLCLAWSVCTGL